MVLVTGATGILGRVIVLELLKRGKKVRATKRKTSSLSEVLQSYSHYTNQAEEFFNKIEWIEVDFTDLLSLQDALIGVTEVYHCAAKVSFHPKDEKEMYLNNINGTKNLLYACEKSSVEKFLHVSSVAVLDGYNEKGEMDEDSDYNAKWDHSAYAISKQFSEMEVWRASAEGLSAVIINPAIIIGTGNWQQSSGELIPTFEKNAFTFSGGSAYVDVRDVSNIALELMEKNCFGERFVIISENKKYETIGNQIRSQLGLKKLKILPKSALQFGRILKFLFGWLIPSLRMATKSNIDAVTTETHLSNAKVKQKLDYQFIPVSESVDFHLKNYIKDKNSIKNNHTTS